MVCKSLKDWRGREAAASAQAQSIDSHARVDRAAFVLVERSTCQGAHAIRWEQADGRAGLGTSFGSSAFWY